MVGLRLALVVMLLLVGVGVCLWFAFGLWLRWLGVLFVSCRGLVLFGFADVLTWLATMLFGCGFSWFVCFGFVVSVVLPLG